MFYEKKPSVVWTILGSCLGICFYNERLKIGAIIHAQLPERRLDGLKCTDSCPVKCAKNSPHESAYKFVECSMKNVLSRFNREGISNNEIQVKLFGGANMLDAKSQLVPVGQQNIEKAIQIVEKYNLALVSQNTGGINGRKIFFLTDTGEVYLKKINDNLNQINSNI